MAIRIIIIILTDHVGRLMLARVTIIGVVGGHPAAVSMYVVLVLWRLKDFSMQRFMKCMRG